MALKTFTWQLEERRAIEMMGPSLPTAKLRLDLFFSLAHDLKCHAE